MFPERSGIIVWFSDLKAASKHLEKYGNVHYLSKKLHYAAMYVYSSRLDETVKQLQKLPFVKKKSSGRTAMKSKPSIIIIFLIKQDSTRYNGGTCVCICYIIRPERSSARRIFLFFSKQPFCFFVIIG